MGLYKIMYAIAVFPFFQGSMSLEPNWSLCDNAFFGNCWNGLATDDARFDDLKPMSVSVRGLVIFFVHGWRNEPTGLAEFVFQERVGDYHMLSPETTQQVIRLKLMGSAEYRYPGLTLVNELSLISDGATRIFETTGSIDDCFGARYPVKSLALNGAERWELIGKNGDSVCIQVENTNSFIPAIVRDVRSLGFDFDDENKIVCGVVRGCSKPPSEIIRLPNNETSGVLRR